MWWWQLGLEERRSQHAAGRQLNFAYETVLKTARRGKAGASDP